MAFTTGEFSFTVRVKVKYIKDPENPPAEDDAEIMDEIRMSLEDDANPGTVYGTENGEYEITEWAVTQNA